MFLEANPEGMPVSPRHKAYGNFHLDYCIKLALWKTQAYDTIQQDNLQK